MIDKTMSIERLTFLPLSLMLLLEMLTIGYHNKPFNIIKFRSMVQNAEAAGKPQLSSENDPRITPFGRFMR